MGVKGGICIDDEFKDNDDHHSSHAENLVDFFTLATTHQGADRYRTRTAIQHRGLKQHTPFLQVETKMTKRS